MNPKMVDIVIPVYNKTQYLADLCQKLKNLSSSKFNVIFVDDGSTDNSVVVISSLIENLDNFYLFNKINGGVSSARNLGLDKCLSKYIWFIDPDDSIPNIQSLEIDELLQKEADIIVFNYSVHTVLNNRSECFIFKENGFFQNNYFFKRYDALGSKEKNMNIVWNKWYKREFLEGIRFNEKIRLGEDRLFNIEVFSKNGKTFFSDIKIYDYYMYESGTLSTGMDFRKVENIYIVNHVNLKVVGYDRNLCKVHIIEQLKLRTILGEKNLASFYRKEHNLLKIKIFPFFNFKELILISMVFLKLNIAFFYSYNFIRKFRKQIIL